jgi:hypothetical protein
MSTPRRESKQQRYARKRAEFIAANPTPYEKWPEEADTMRHFVVKAIAANPSVSLHWSKGSADRDRQLDVTDLAIGLWAVCCNEDKGVSYGQLGRAFKVCAGTGCHRTKAAAILHVLVGLGLTRRTAGHSKGKHGTVYECVKSSWTPGEDDEFLLTLSGSINVSQDPGAPAQFLNIAPAKH